MKHIDGLVDGARSGAAAQTIGDFIREQREAAQVSVRQLARLAGVSNPYLSQIERGLRRPSADILQQIAHGLSISAEQLYTRAGWLDARASEVATGGSGADGTGPDRTGLDGTGPVDVVAAVLADRRLSARHKQLLVEIYRSFVHESAAPASAAPDEADAHDIDRVDIDRVDVDPAPRPPAAVAAPDPAPPAER